MRAIRRGGRGEEELAIVERTFIQPGIQAIFRQRGRSVVRTNQTTDLPKNLNPQNPIDFGDQLYPEMKSRKFRRYLASRLSRVDGLGNASRDMDEERYEQKAKDLGLLEPVNGKLVIAGELLEWFVANCLQREFSCPSFWGVIVEDLPNDFDVITYRGASVGYIECKGGRVEGIDEGKVREFLKREMALSPSFSVFLADDASRERLSEIAQRFLSQTKLYRYEVPGMMNTGIDLEAEAYDSFIRVIPINCFIVSGEKRLKTVFEEVFQFLTVVCDRPMPFENRAAKERFKKKAGET